MYNKQFNLNPWDISLIEEALIELQFMSDDSRKAEINKLLGHIHNQKIWYDPKNNTPRG